MKRIFDIIISALGLVIASPILAIVSLMIWLTMGRPIIFKQMRPGLKGEPFQMIKFRTMNDAKDASGRVLPDAQRLAFVGKLLRSTSVDELPELWNVLKGDMSLVGPRPLLMEYLPLYTSEQNRRHEVRPGVTGWAQINGRNELGWDEKFALDVWYVDHGNFWLDLRIMCLTVVKIFKREGISGVGEVTMTRFEGSK